MTFGIFSDEASFDLDCVSTDEVALDLQATDLGAVDYVVKGRTDLLESTHRIRHDEAHPRHDSNVQPTD